MHRNAQPLTGVALVVVIYFIYSRSNKLINEMYSVLFHRGGLFAL